jgi:hypothetical protein
VDPALTIHAPASEVFRATLRNDERLGTAALYEKFLHVVQAQCAGPFVLLTDHGPSREDWDKMQSDLTALARCGRPERGEEGRLASSLLVTKGADEGRYRASLLRGFGLPASELGVKFKDLLDVYCGAPAVIDGDMIVLYPEDRGGVESRSRGSGGYGSVNFHCEG